MKKKIDTKICTVSTEVQKCECALSIFAFVLKAFFFVVHNEILLMLLLWLVFIVVNYGKRAACANSHYLMLFAIFPSLFSMYLSLTLVFEFIKKNATKISVSRFFLFFA